MKSIKHQYPAQRAVVLFAEEHSCMVVLEIIIIYFGLLFKLLN